LHNNNNNRATSVHQQVSHFYRRRASNSAHAAVAAESSANNGGGEGLVSLRALTLIATIIQELIVGGSHNEWANKVAVTAGMIQASLPAIIRVCQHGNVFGASPSYDAAEIVLVIVCWLTTFFFVFVGVSFITTGVVDYLRRAHLLQVMGIMIDPAGATMNTGTRIGWRPTFIDFTIPSNISAWFTLRQILMDYGLEFRKRINIYSSYALVFATGLLCTLFYYVIADPDE
jgi:hypothetical protein